MSNYTKDNLLPITKEDVPVGSLVIKIGDEIFPLTIGKGGGGSGFQLVKVTNYHPAREGMSEPETVTFSGLGTVESQYGGDPVDFSDVNGDYVVTEETKFKKGLARVYKQQNGKYYLCGYDPSGMDWAEYSAHWYVSETVGGYGYSAKMSRYNSAEIPEGDANWSNDNIGEFSVTTTVLMGDYPALTETYPAQSVTAFDTDTAEWTEGEAVDISSYSITPQTNGIYFAQDGKLIGQHIDRQLHIPENGLARRFKAVDGHFVDKMWGTEMMPSGDISYDELGYCGNSAAPMAKTIGSYIDNRNTLSPFERRTYNIFVKPIYNPGNRTVWAIADEGSASYEYGAGRFWLMGNGLVRFGSCGKFVDSTSLYNLCQWNMITATAEYRHEWREAGDRIIELHLKVYINGRHCGSFDQVADTGSWVSNIEDTSGNKMRFFANMNSSSESFIGQIDEACVWNRILTDEEIADMAKGLEGFNWDIPVKPYVNKKPLMYASLSERSDLSDSGQQLAYTGSVSFVTSSDRQCARIEGQNNFIHVKPADDPLGRYNINNKFTLAAWIRATDPENHSAFITFSGGQCGNQPTSTSLVNEVWLSCRNTVSLGDGSGNYTMVSTNIDGSVWRHMTATWDGTQFKLYVDGVFVGSYVGHGHSFTNYLYLYINSLERAPQAVIGYGEYADVCLYDRVLSDAEIAELYNGTLF